MSVIITHEYKDRIYSSFGETLEDAQAAAEEKLTELTAQGDYVELEVAGDLLYPGLYGWNVKVKSQIYK